MKSIGRKIHTLRKNKHLTQEQLAEALSVSAQSVSKWENQISTPDVALLPIIARYFGITMDELFNYRLDSLSYKERFIRFMADNGVLRFGEFKLQSKRVSPYFINTGDYRSASQITKLGEFYARCISEHGIRGNLLVGSTNKDIPLMVSTGMVLYQKYGQDMNYGVISSIGKKPDAKDEMILIQDALTSGNTLKENLHKLRQIAGKFPAYVIVSLDRMERGEHSTVSARHEIEQEFGLRIFPVVDAQDIIHALENGVIAGMEYLDVMREYQKKYGGH
ncbi:MAG: helix-turn-helix domain-containing protein [Lachnospiraceae bacterium]|nr:helix-turn-helix domain-containing protein [Lachnospiraceae bacterium]